MKGFGIRIIGVLTYFTVVGAFSLKAQSSEFVPGMIILNTGDTLNGEIHRTLKLKGDLGFRFNEYFPDFKVPFEYINRFRYYHGWYARKNVPGKGIIFIEDQNTAYIPLFRIQTPSRTIGEEPVYTYYFQLDDEERLIKLDRSAFNKSLLPALKPWPDAQQEVNRIGFKPAYICSFLQRERRKLNQR